MILGTKHDARQCLADFGYLAYIGGIFIALGMLCILRMGYMVTFFVFGNKVFQHFLREDELQN